jgi:hypothetical protein
MKVFIPFAFILVITALPLTAIETDDAVKRLQTGEKPDAHDQDFWRKNYDAWLESERVSPSSGDQSLGQALYDLSEGRMPDENGTDAVMHLYNVSKSQATPADNNDLSKPDTGTKPRSYSPPPEPGSERPIIAVIVAFLVAVAVMAGAAKLVHRKR